MTVNLKFKFQPWQHQLDALEFFARAPSGSALLRHDMGTGKTTTAALCIRLLANQLKRVPRVLIVCPNSIVDQWPKHIVAACYENISSRVATLRGDEKKKLATLADPARDIFIINWECVRSTSVPAKLKAEPWDLVILDESQRIKDPGSKASKLFRAIARNAGRSLLLSGTPITNSPQDAWAQLYALGAEVDANISAFRFKYFYNKNQNNPHVSFAKWELNPFAAEDFIAMISAVKHEASKEECLDLPPFLRVVIEVNLPEHIRGVYDELHEHFVAQLPEGGEIVTPLVVTKMLRLQELCCGVAKTVDGNVETFQTEKLAALADILDGIGTEKAVVWSNFTTPMPMIEATLRKAGIEYRRFTGKEDAEQRADAIKAFQSKPEVRVMLASQSAGGVGVDGLQVASVCVYFSKSFNLEHDMQSEARTYRGGSEIHKKVTRYDIVTRETIEETITRALANKLELAEVLLGLKQRNQRQKAA